MWLKLIKLTNFRRLVDFQAQFSPGINAVKGPLNEMGKSTLLEGIIAALFYNPKGAAKKLKDYVSWGATRRYETSLDFENNGNAYLLEKNFEKGTIKFVDYSRQVELDSFKEISERLTELLGTNSETLFLCTSCIRQDQVREISSGKKEIGDSLEEAVTGGEENILASEVVQKLDNKLSEIKRGLDRPAKSPGRLASLKARLENVSQRYKEVKTEVSKVEAQKTELVEIKKELSQIREEYKNSKTLLERNKQRREIEASIEDLKQKYDEVEKLLTGINMLIAKSREASETLNSISGFESEMQVSEVGKGLEAIEVKREIIVKDLVLRQREMAGAESRIAELNGKSGQVEQELKAIECFEASQQVSELKKKLEAVQIRRGDIEGDLAKGEEDIGEAKKRLDGRKSLNFFGSRQSVASAAIIFIGGIVGIMLGPLYLLSLVILGMAFLVATMWARTSLAREKTEIYHWEERIQGMKEALGELDQEEKDVLAGVKCKTVNEFGTKERDFYYWLEERKRFENQLSIERAKASDLEDRVLKMEEALEELNSQERTLLTKVKCNTFEEFKGRESNFHKWVGEKGRQDNQLKGKLGGKTVEEVEQQRSEIIRKLRVTEDRLTGDLIGTRLSPEKYVELENKVRSLEQRQAELENRERHCQAVIEVAGADAEDQIKLEEEMEDLQEALKQEEKRVKVYELAKEFMSRARVELFLSANEALGREIQRYFAIFTNGKYKQVRISQEGLEFWLYSDEKGDWAKPEELSGGTMDEFYLASRLALVKFIFSDKKPPLILDDPFVNFDQVRLAKTLDFLKKIAEEHQIIIFTLRDIYDRIADKIVVLE